MDETPQTRLRKGQTHGENCAFLVPAVGFDHYTTAHGFLVLAAHGDTNPPPPLCFLILFI